MVAAQPLTQDSYRAYGDVVSARDDINPVNANMGTAKRFNRTTTVANLRPQSATPNICVFQCQPQIAPGDTAFAVKILERHAHSTQAFFPMRGAERYLVVVCLGGDQPDLATLRAFVANNAQGITYKPGVWHHPLIAMEHATDFACVVWEDGTAGDCDVVQLPTPSVITIPPS